MQYPRIDRTSSIYMEKSCMFRRLTTLLYVGLLAGMAQAQPTITQQPADQATTNGGSVAFSVVVSGTGPFTYQWRFNGTNTPNNVITTIAGNGINAFAGDGGAATNASVSRPAAMAMDVAGNLYIADSDNNRIRKVDTNGFITTVAGYSAGYSGDGGAATNAKLFYPYGVAMDTVGNLYIADSINNRVRVVDTNGIIRTVAGNGIAAYAGDGGAATNASLNTPWSVTADAVGNLFIVDTANNRIRKVATNGIITTVAGNGTYGYSGDGGPATNANLSSPRGVAVDSVGSLYIADYENNCVRRVGTNGIITTVAGNGSSGNSGDGGRATNATFQYTAGVALDAAGNLYIVDTGNCRIRKVVTNGIITTVVGNGSAGYTGDGGAPTNASLYFPYGVMSDAVGNVYIGDTANYRVREAQFSQYPTYRLRNVSTNNAGNFSVVITSSSGSVTSRVATLAIGTLPKITQQPVDQTSWTGTSATFLVTASGTAPLNYQWTFNGTNIAGATNASYTISNVTTNGAGYYSAIVTNRYGSAASGSATLTVNYLTESRVVTNGTIAVFCVSLPVAGPLSYRWLFNGNYIPNDIITTVAGSNTGYSGDGSAATNALLYFPASITVDGAGNLFIADTDNHRVRRVGTDGIITTVAGTGTAGYSGDGGVATNANLYLPNGVAVDSMGNLFIADTDNHRIRKVETNGVITTVAGTGTAGYSGDGGAATGAKLHYPSGVTVDGLGNLFIADTVNYRVRRVEANGIITTVAGTGTAGYSGDGGASTNAKLYLPWSSAVDGAGNLFIADYGNNCVREVGTNGIITTVAGTGTAGYSGDGGSAANAKLFDPEGVSLDSIGNLFVADYGNNRVREVGTNSIITTVAGSGMVGRTGDGGSATNAAFYGPTGVAVDGAGNLFIADKGNSHIREVGFTGSPALTLYNVTSDNTGNYQVIVTGSFGSITSSVTSLTVVWPPVISRLANNADGSVMLNLTTTTNVSSRIYATTNLAMPVVWQPIYTNLTGGIWQFTDPNTSETMSKFYLLSTP